MKEECKQAWWENSTNLDFIIQFIKHPFVVMRQICVACDMNQAPPGSDHETYPTLSPADALTVARLPQDQCSNKQLSSLICAAKNGSEAALTELSLIALGGNESARTAIHEIDNSPWSPTSTSVVLKDITWPQEVESGQRGPQLGDIPLHNNF